MSQPVQGRSKQSARPSALMVSAPSRIAAERLLTNAEGLAASRPLGSGKIAASRAYGANIAVVRTQDDMLKSLIDSKV